MLKVTKVWVLLPLGSITYKMHFPDIVVVSEYYKLHSNYRVTKFCFYIWWKYLLYFKNSILKDW